MDELETRYGLLATPDIEADLIGRHIVRYGEWAWDEVCFVAAALPEGARVLDVGAFVGTFGIGLSQRKMLNSLCLVEGNAAVVPLLDRNVTRNVRVPTKVVEAVVTAPWVKPSTGRGVPGNLGATSFVPAGANDEAEATGAPLQTTTLVDLRTEFGDFDLIKLDVEGMELEILRSDADHLSRGDTTLWIECNESPDSLEIARLLLTWGLEVHYFAWPAYNPDNFRGDVTPILPFAYEAGLLAAPKNPPSLDEALRSHGCILRSIQGLDDLKNAMWRTPRWGLREWLGADHTAIIALTGRALCGESFETYLAPGWSAGEPLHRRLEVTKQALHAAEALALERLAELQAAQDRINTAEALALERLAQIEAERRRADNAEAAMRAERAGRLQAEASASNLIQRLTALESSTAWRITAMLCRVVERRPRLHRLLQRAVRVARPIARHLRSRVRSKLLVLGSHASKAPSAEDMSITAPHFDAAYYLAANPDVAQAGVDPLAHFLTTGWREGRNPSRAFDVEYYLKDNPDVAAAGINPLLHYILAGARENRRPRNPLAAWRDQLEAAKPPRERAIAWASGADRTHPMPLSLLLEILETVVGSAGFAIAVSHDDYAQSCGGVQNLIGDEQQAFNRARWNYLHVSPAAPLPMLANSASAEDFRVALRLDGKRLGIATFADLLAAAAALHERGVIGHIIMHHLMGHELDLIRALIRASAGPRPIVWTHDFFTLCPSYSLMRNDIMFCGAPAPESAACGICCYGEERIYHIARMRSFFEDVRPIVLAPSQTALDIWKRCNLAHMEARVLPPARLIPGDVWLSRTDSRLSLRVAHIGARSFQKGWPIFEELALRFRGDSRYEFFHLGISDGAAVPGHIRHVPVRVDAEHRDAMTQAIAREEIDVAVVWSLVPETFSFTTHEALAAGAFVVTHPGAGNVRAAIAANAPANGCAVANQEELFALFEGNELWQRVSAAPRRGGKLAPTGGAADLLVTGHRDGTLNGFLSPDRGSTSSARPPEDIAA